MAKTDADRRADRFRWAVAIVPLLGICCFIISFLVIVGLVDLGWTLMTHHRPFVWHG